MLACAGFYHLLPLRRFSCCYSEDLGEFRRFHHCLREKQSTRRPFVPGPGLSGSAAQRKLFTLGGRCLKRKNHEQALHALLECGSLHLVVAVVARCQHFLATPHALLQNLGQTSESKRSRTCDDTVPSGPSRWQRGPGGSLKLATSRDTVTAHGTAGARNPATAKLLSQRPTLTSVCADQGIKATFRARLTETAPHVLVSCASC